MTVKQTVEITNKLGMHARPAMKLFELMQGFEAEVLLRNDEGTEAEANSVIALLMLDSAKGRQIEVEATGPQEVEALAAVVALFNSGVASRSDKAFTPHPAMPLCRIVPDALHLNQANKNSDSSD